MKDNELNLDTALCTAKINRDIRNFIENACVDQPTDDRMALTLANRIKELQDNSPIRSRTIEWKIMALSFRLLGSMFEIAAIANGRSGNVAEERAKGEVLLEELKKILKAFEGVDSAEFRLRKTELLSEVRPGAELVLGLLRGLPLPTSYWQGPRSSTDIVSSPENIEGRRRSLLCVTVDIDDSPLVSPKILRIQTLYPLIFKVKGIYWPNDAKFLRLDLLSSCPIGSFSCSELILKRGQEDGDGRYEGEISGEISFAAARSKLLNDLVIMVQAAFFGDDRVIEELLVIGHNEFRFRVVNDTAEPLMTGNRTLDQHVVELLGDLESKVPTIQPEINALLEVLQTIVKLRSAYAQEALFKGRSNISEAEFQKTVLRDLRIVLGPDVKEHPAQAGGITDIQYRGLTLELKVERENGNRQLIATNYSKQATQYAGSDGKQISIVLVLDITEKDSPPGDIRNDIFVVDVTTHGSSDDAVRFPSKAIICVINGNMKSPSNYSR